jgi:hypothetical protein
MNDDNQKLTTLNDIVVTLVQFYPDQMENALRLTYATSDTAQKHTLQGSIFFTRMFFYPDQIDDVLQFVSSMDDADKKILLKDIFINLVSCSKQAVIALEFAKFMNLDDQEIILDTLLRDYHRGQIKRAFQLANEMNCQSKKDESLEKIVHKILGYDSNLGTYTPRDSFQYPIEVSFPIVRKIKNPSLRYGVLRTIFIALPDNNTNRETIEFQIAETQKELTPGCGNNCSIS